jgi:hypothetical protein
VRSATSTGSKSEDITCEFPTTPGTAGLIKPRIRTAPPATAATAASSSRSPCTTEASCSPTHGPTTHRPAAKSNAAYAARPKAAASGIPLIDGHYRVRPDTIDRNGKLTLRHASRLHHIGMGARHRGTTVLILVHDLHVRILSTTGQLLRDFQLDLTRDYQPQNTTPPA